ncbi:group III truncated hemoglobin [Fibrella aquatilis]|uniref:Group III truncated hemoglobin n=1 Tax=Fibrella aquatilis TaxID=2817059 RepID=A0A939G320_9BACT|nr:group III truncated hemoglobin [Fibrella aquatilis]MBO0929372.1 group III truncated hemoglobin [Fibrella aquatilis]
MHDIQNRTDIDHLVATFYGRVFADEQIGLVFTLVARVTPETHFPLLGDFWETVLFGQNRYHGNVILKHVELHLKQALQPAQFDRWVSLFCLTVDDLFIGTVAETAKIRARTMSMVLQAKLHTLTQSGTHPNAHGHVDTHDALVL